MEIGREIRRLREAKGWSQAKLAAAADMGVSGISQIETGARNPSAVTLSKIAEALGVGVADLFPKAQSPLPLEEIPAFRRGDLTEAERANIERQVRGEAKPEAFFVPLEEGEEPDVVTLRLYVWRKLEEDDAVVQEVAKYLQERDKAKAEAG
jgi:transcriptional regulator with XRE-family HTH domain